MDLRKQIEKELNKTDFFQVNLHNLLELMLKHEIQYSPINKNDDFYDNFNKHPIINCIQDFFADKQEKYTIHKSSFAVGSLLSLKISKIGKTKDEIIIISSFNETLNGTNYLITSTTGHNKKKVGFSDYLESDIHISTKSNGRFILNSRTNFDLNRKTRHTNYSEHSDLKLKFIFDAIVNKKSLDDAFELLHIQYDFIDENFKENVKLCFKNNEIERHSKLLSKINKIKKIKTLKQLEKNK